MAQLNSVRLLHQAAKNSPWLFIAIALHAVIIAGLSVIYLAGEREKPNLLGLTMRVTQKPRTEPIEPPPVIERRPPPKNEEVELVDYAEPQFTLSELAAEVSVAPGDPSSESSQEAGGNPAIGAGNLPGRTGTGVSPFPGRGPNAKGPAGSGRPGPSDRTEKSVLEGLRWLARHQQSDGSWDATSLPDCCVDKTACVAASQGFPEFWREGLTGLALLAFLGAGYNFDAKEFLVDPVQAKKIRLGEVVKNGLKWLKSHQLPDGSFGPDQHVYNQALCTLALCEAYGMSKHLVWKQPAQKAIDWLVRAQKTNPDGTGGLWGWRYHSSADVQALVDELNARKAAVEAKQAPLDSRREELELQRRELEGQRANMKPAEFELALKQIAEQVNEIERGLEELKPEIVAVTAGLQRVLPELYDSDLSVTTWVIMAFKSAEASGLAVPRDAYLGGKEFALSVSTVDGQAGYLSRAGSGRPVAGTGDHFDYHTGTMGALSMLCRTFVDHDIADPFLEKAAQQLVKDVPEVSKDRLSIDYYYWYYASLALNQFDGPESPRKGRRYWDPWNRAMVQAVLSTQDGTETTCARGGWVIPDRWSLNGGPIYATAINVLTLEVYYRYANAFK